MHRLRMNLFLLILKKLAFIWIPLLTMKTTVGGQSTISQSGWIYWTLRTELTEKMEILGEEDLEPGMYRQMRFILGADNELVIDGQRIPLTYCVSRQVHSLNWALKLNINAEIKSNSTYTLLLDLADASRSIVQAGNSGKYLPKSTYLIPDISPAKYELRCQGLPASYISMLANRLITPSSERYQPSNIMTIKNFTKRDTVQPFPHYNQSGNTFGGTSYHIV